METSFVSITSLMEARDTSVIGAGHPSRSPRCLNERCQSFVIIDGTPYSGHGGGPCKLWGADGVPQWRRYHT